MKFDLNQIEADLVDFVAEIEATPEAKPVFVEAPDWDAEVLKDIQLSTIKDLTYGENTKTILRTSFSLVPFCRPHLGGSAVARPRPQFFRISQPKFQHINSSFIIEP